MDRTTASILQAMAQNAAQDLRTTGRPDVSEYAELCETIARAASRRGADPLDVAGALYLVTDRAATILSDERDYWLSALRIHGMARDVWAALSRDRSAAGEVVPLAAQSLARTLELGTLRMGRMSRVA